METSQRTSEEYTTLNTKSRQRKQDSWGRTISTLCIGLIALLVVSIIYFIAARGLTTFFKDGVSFATFFTGTTWDPTSGAKYVGALPMIVTSFSVTLLAAVVATPFALAIALFTTELAPKRSRGLIQSMVELLVGIPSVVYGFIGLAVLVPVIRNLFGGTGSGILTATLVLFVMILPTITSLTIESLRSVPRDYRSASFALGATMWQTMHRVILRAALPGILTAVIFGMARAFGEALAVQMVIGNAAVMPTSLISPSATLTSILTAGIGNTVMGTLPNDALWSLALVLLLMSLIFNLLVRTINKKGVEQY